MAEAKELTDADAMRIVVQSERIVISRCADPDDSVYMQVMAQPGINDWLAANQMECWCQSCGTFPAQQSMLVIAAFAPAQVRALPQPRSEVELSDHSRERGVLESDVINVFGVQLRVTAAPAMGQVSFGLREVALDPAPPLDAVKGVAIITSCFLLTGPTADRLVNRKIASLERLDWAPLAVAVTEAVGSNPVYAAEVVDGWWQGEYVLGPTPWHPSTPARGAGLRQVRFLGDGLFRLLHPRREMR